MKEFLVVVFFCLPACGQAAYSGLGLYSGSAAYGSSVCGPPSYASPCSISDVFIHPYVTPIPSWGPNTACMNAANTIYDIAQCGNLTGAGVTLTTNDDFHAIMTRCTDATIATTTTDVNAVAHNWETADEPSVNLWNTDDTAILPLINSGKQWVFLWDGAACHLLKDSGGNGISFPAGSGWSKSLNNHVYSLDNTTAGGPYLIDNAVDLHQPSSGVTSSTLFNFNQNTCLTNTANGYTGGTFPLNQWTGAITSQDGVHFATFFSLLPGQGSGYYAVAWAVGQAGCDLYNTLTGVVTHNGTPLGTIPDTQWGGAFGGKADRWGIHDGNMPNPTVITVSGTLSNFVYGTYNVGAYFWQVGTTNVLKCGIGAPDWKASNAYVDGNRILPIPNTPTSTNPGGYIYQIINGVSGNSGPAGSEPNPWNQTPGGDQADGTLTWRNVGLNGSAVYNCDGHTYKGYVGVVAGGNFTYHTYADPSTPLLKLGPTDSMGNPISSPGDQHLGNTNANGTDTSWIFVGSTDVGTSTDLLHGPFPGALYMEQFFVAPPHRSPSIQNCLYNPSTCSSGTLGQVRRVAHCYGTGWHKAFDVQNCIPVVSQTGKYEIVTTDAMGQFGNTSGQAKCNPGGPDWSNNSSTFSVGSLIYPNLGQSNGEAYVYQAQSCSGTCTTGATHPTWIQNSTVAGVGTFTDGTITWKGAPDINTPTNTAAQNCRADVMVVKLTR